ncbi:MAG: hypothetical protein ABH873_04200 [Candidatus Firestonebacteria bacterium]
MKNSLKLYVILTTLLLVGLFSVNQSVKAAVVDYQTITLISGWNIVSTPKILSSHEFSVAQTSDNFDIYLLDPTSPSGWQTMQGIGQTEFQPLFAYFINNKTGQDQTLRLNYNFDLTPAQRLFQRTLHSGWNAIGIASPSYALPQNSTNADINNPSNILSSITGSIGQVIDFTNGNTSLDSPAISNNWLSKIASDVNSLNDFRELKGYGIFVTSTTDNYIGSQNLSLPIQYTLTYTAGANGSITGTSSQIVPSGLNGTTVTAVPASGHHFVNWSDELTVNPRTDTNVTADINITANFGVISQSSGMTITLDGATNPSAKSFVNGTSGQLLSAFRFTAGPEENLRVSRLKLSLGGTGAGTTDINNLALYRYDEATGVEILIDSATNFVGTTATFGADSIGLDSGIFDVVKSNHVVIHVRADIPNSASYTTIGIYVNEVKVDGILSQGNLVSEIINISAVDTLGEVTNHTANASVGTIAMATSSSTPTTQAVAPGTTDFEFLAVDFTASREDIILSSVVVNLYDAADQSNVAQAADFVNVKLWDGATQLGSTVSSPTSTAAFSINLTLAKDVIKTLKVTSDIPSDTVSANRWDTYTASIAIDADIYATGVSSGAVVADPGVDALGQNMTALLPGTLTVSFLSLDSTTQIINTANAELAKVVLTGGADEDIRVSSIKFTTGSDTELTYSGATDYYIGSLKLYDGATQVGTVISAFTDSGSITTVQFAGLSVIIPKATQKVLTLKGNILVGSNVGIATGIADLTGTTDVIGTGLSSYITIYGTGTDTANSGVITLVSAGTLAVAVASDTPVAANVAVGASGVDGVVFNKIRFTATNEAINLEALNIYLQTDGINNVPDIEAIHLYNGSTEVSAPGYLTGDSSGADVAHTFYISGVQVPKDGSVTLTLKVDLNGISEGATSNHTPRFYLTDITGAANLSAAGIKAVGASSGATVTSVAGSPNPETAINFNEMTLAKTKPTFALSTGTPSGTLVAGTMRVLDFNITADAKGDVIFTTGDSITFTVLGSQNDNDTTTDTITVYRADTDALVGISSGAEVLTVGATSAVQITDTIPAGTTRNYYVECTLTDFENDGDSFALKINSTLWNDGIVNVSNALTSGLPVNGLYFVNPS